MGRIIANRPNINNGNRCPLVLCLSSFRHRKAKEMEPPATASNRSSRRLLFDRRYGWVVDDWKDPSEEALAGGRGMFCVVPLTKTLFQTASQSISSAVNFLDMKLQNLKNPMHNPKSSFVDTSADSRSE